MKAIGWRLGLEYTHQSQTPEHKFRDFILVDLIIFIVVFLASGYLLLFCLYLPRIKCLNLILYFPSLYFTQLFSF